MTERTPSLATTAAAPHSALRQVPVSILLDNVRSMHNVGSFFRTADAGGCEKLYLCGITGRPPKRAITKTALGAEETVPLGASCRSWRAGPTIAAAELRDRRSRDQHARGRPV